MSIKISSRKQKARNLQYKVCEKIAEIFEVNFDQNDDNCYIHSREMGQHGKDIILRSNLYNMFKYDIECKAVEKFNLYQAINQAKDNTENNRNWLVIHKKKNNDPIVILDFDVFFDLIRKTIY